MSKELAIRDNNNSILDFSDKEMTLLRSTICKNCTTEDVELFIMVCRNTGLNPFFKQIYPVIRKTSMKNPDNGQWEKVESMTIQTGIDGYRLIAERTGRYCPGREPTFTYDKNSRLLSATAYVKKQTRDGQWHELSASAFYSEYVQAFVDKKTGVATPSQFWEKMPHNQLAKCAESLALRKAFPAELSDLYTKEEMEQSENSESVIVVEPQKQSLENTSSAKRIVISMQQAEELKITVLQCPEEYQNDLKRFMKNNQMEDYRDLTPELFDKIIIKARAKRDEYIEEKENEYAAQKAMEKQVEVENADN